jgi:hypothetical protein
MNDRIRNSLSAIESIVYATNPHVTDPVKDAVDTIENVLQEVLSPGPSRAFRLMERHVRDEHSSPLPIESYLLLQHRPDVRLDGRTRRGPCNFQRNPAIRCQGRLCLRMENTPDDPANGVGGGVGNGTYGIG